MKHCPSPILACITTLNNPSSFSSVASFFMGTRRLNKTSVLRREPVACLVLLGHDPKEVSQIGATTKQILHRYLIVEVDSSFHFYIKNFKTFLGLVLLR